MKNLNEAQTLSTELNVFQSFSPKIPAAYEDSEYLFLANIDPVLQADVRRKMPKVKMVCGDTMNYWIKDHAENLAAVLENLDALLINDTEVKMLAKENNLLLAARKVLAMGPKSLVVKHGEYGATAFFSDQSFAGQSLTSKPHATTPFRAPALPLAEVVDPTGAGDSFAGGFFGYIASQPELTPAVFRRAMFYGGVMGSFAVERFGTERLQQLELQRNRGTLCALPPALAPRVSQSGLNPHPRRSLPWIPPAACATKPSSPASSPRCSPSSPSATAIPATCSSSTGTRSRTCTPRAASSIPSTPASASSAPSGSRSRICS